MARVSCVIPMKDCAAFVAETLRALLGQTHDNLQIIVVDDGSTDDSPDIVRQIIADHPRGGCIEMIAGPREGIAPALMAGLARCDGDYWCRCDADDVYEPAYRLARQVVFLEERGEFDAVCGVHRIVGAGDAFITDWPMAAEAGEITDELRGGTGRTHLCTFLIRLPLVKQLGFRPFFNGCEDADFQLRLGDSGRIWFEDAPAYVYRLHAGGITQQQKLGRRLWMERTLRAFQLERQQHGTDPLDRGEAVPVPDEAALSKLAADAPAAARLEARVQTLLLGRGHHHRMRGERTAALAATWQAIRAGPGNGDAWRQLLSTLLKRTPPPAASEKEKEERKAAVTAADNAYGVAPRS